MSGSDFLSFKSAVIDFIGFEKGVAFEVLHDIYTMAPGAEPFVYNFPEFRRSSELCLAALLLAKWKGLRVIFLSPTTYYGFKAYSMMRVIARQNKYEITNVTVTVAGLVTPEMAKSAHVFLHHGRDFRCFLPAESAEKQHVMQIFENEEVPHDTRSLSALIRAKYSDD